MSTAPVEYGDHPVADAVARIHAELDELVDTAVWSMSPAVLARTLPALTRAKARVAEVELRVAQQAERVGLGTEVGAADTTAWWANTTRMTKGEAHRLAKLAKSLDFAHEPIRDALAAGGLLVDQAQVIIDAVDALPEDLVSAEVAAQAEAHLIGLAADYDAKALRILGRKVLDVIAPQIGEEHERRILEAQEANARKGARFTMGEDGHGQCHGRFTISSLHGAMLKKALLAIAAPKHQAATAAAGQAAPFGDRVAAPLRMGQAFSEYIENYPTDHLPNAGGAAATVVVTIDLQALTDELGVATTDLGVDLSASEARRLACEAGILPVVLGGKSQVLDVGRKARFHTTTQRIALGIRDKGCTAVGCDWPPGMCHAHHNEPWHQGGGTSLNNGRLLCPRHHSYAHNPTYEMNDAGGDKVSFHHRT